MKSYLLLDEGEIIKEGDEHFNESECCWFLLPDHQHGEPLSYLEWGVVRRSQPERNLADSAVAKNNKQSESLLFCKKCKRRLPEPIYSKKILCIHCSEINEV